MVIRGSGEARDPGFIAFTIPGAATAADCRGPGPFHAGKLEIAAAPVAVAAGFAF